MESPADDSLWPWPGLAFVATLVIGVALMVPSFRNRSTSAANSETAQSIQSGGNSRNYQAGGNINIGATDETP